MNPKELVDLIHKLYSYEHTIIYYGPESPKQFSMIISKLHHIPFLKKVPKGKEFKQRLTPENKVIFVDYKTKQAFMRMLSNRGEKYNFIIKPILTLYNQYFGEGMNSIVFQEMRKTRALAYTAWATLDAPPTNSKEII